VNCILRDFSGTVATMKWLAHLGRKGNAHSSSLAKAATNVSVEDIINMDH
jgi:hypothetical protein